MLQVNVHLKLRILYATLTLLSAFILIASACSSTPALQVIEHSIVVQEFTGDISQSNARVTGVAVNSSAWAINDCRIEVTYYDYSRNVIGNSSATLEKLEAGEEWNFQTEYRGTAAWEVAGYSVSASNK